MSESNKISKKQFLLVTFLCTLMFASGYCLKSIILHQTARLHVNVFFQFERFSGDSELEIHNVITNIGENITMAAFAYGYDGNVTKLAVGNATGTLTTKTVLDAVYNDPTDGQYPVDNTPEIWFNNGDISYNVTWTWTFEETVRLDASGLYLHNTTYAYAIANFPEGALTWNPNENLTVLWALTYNCN